MFFGFRNVRGNRSNIRKGEVSDLYLLCTISTRNKRVYYLNASSNKQAEGIAVLMQINRNASNEKAKKILGWKPVADNEEVIIASEDSMIEYGIIK